MASSKMFVLPLHPEGRALLAPLQDGNRVANHAEAETLSLPAEIVLRNDGCFALIPVTPKPDDAGYDLHPANKYSLSLLRLCEKEQREYVVMKDAASCGIHFKVGDVIDMALIGYYGTTQLILQLGQEGPKTKPQLTLDTTTEASEGESEGVQKSVESAPASTKGPKNRKKPQRRASWACPRSPTPLRQEVKQEEEWEVSHVEAHGGSAEAV